MNVLVGRKAPDFTVPAVLGSGEIVDKFNLPELVPVNKLLVNKLS